MGSSLVAGQSDTLTPGAALVSPSGQFALTLQSDGNVCLYANGDTSHALWATHTTNLGGVRLTMQTDGNLVLYGAAGKAVWSTKTAGKGGTVLTMQDDGNAVIYTSSQQPTWATNTAPAELARAAKHKNVNGWNQFWGAVAHGAEIAAQDTGKALEQAAKFVGNNVGAVAEAIGGAVLIAAGTVGEIAGGAGTALIAAGVSMEATAIPQLIKAAAIPPHPKPAPPPVVQVQLVPPPLPVPGNAALPSAPAPTPGQGGGGIHVAISEAESLWHRLKIWIERTL